jgi:serine/threonine protein kinase HipA of HipAB toxin-antitoxin module
MWQAPPSGRRFLLYDVDQQFLRMVFNVLARNQDDHVKNIAFLMDRSGTLRLSPAYDVIWAFNPSGDWTSRRQISIDGERDHFVTDDLVAYGKAAPVRDLAIQAESIRTQPDTASRTKKSRERLGFAPAANS